ncbi:glycosyltransferase [Synechocystis sp. FACHB-383]|uniref:glycosyltransferase n=1 Tax=Synechocystis sp. FACHB-383 TaxID=2692864 RepID=UPI0018EFFC1D|nr:glycosyltransferase [Synechocystis sp. FACHB-383]
MKFTQHKDTKFTKIIVISSITPQPTSAGQIILYRHLSQLEQDNIVVVVSPPDKANGSSWIVKILSRLERTRWHQVGNDLAVLLNGQHWDHTINSSLLKTSVSLVLTVAHGDGCWVALRFARQYKLPLVTIFHDWWPDIPTVHSPLKRILEHRFQQLYEKSSLAFCVSEDMQRYLGKHYNSHVLCPIPAHMPELITAQAQSSPYSERPLKIVYSGGLYDYGPMLGELLQTTKEHSQVKLQVRGAIPNWPMGLRDEMRERGLWLDFAPRDELNDWLASADAFLVTMSFDPALRRRMETSFPSKLPEYAQFGKPIIIWGPEYCSAVKWGLDSDRALVITDKNPTSVVFALEKLQCSPEKQQYYAQQARMAADKEFNPLKIQIQFQEKIQSLAI